MACAINDAGAVVGQLGYPPGPNDYPFQGAQVAVRFRGRSVAPVLAALNAYAAAQATAINNRGDIAGTAVSGSFKGSPVTSIGEMIINGHAIVFGDPLATSSVAALNDHGDAIGKMNGTPDSSATMNGTPFLYTTGKFHSLDGLRAPSGATLTNPRGLNNLAEIVGEGTSDNYKSAYDGGTHAMVVLNGQLIDPNVALVNGGGWVLQSAAAVNNSGRIVGYGVNPLGQVHAILLIPDDTSA